ncbi:YfhE family protein [Sporosarcina sp. FSL W8-0480]|uniref:YfhE family protein n=1 Tax=Sporosarcina sp. FSL W8-0480 TaxID=2954701 RepID=UPI0030D83A38
MNQKKEPHETLTVKNNGLTSTQEVLYAKEFKSADKAAKEIGNQIANKKQEKDQ